MSLFFQAIFSGLSIGALYAAVGIGFVVIHRVTGVVNIAQGATTAFGAYVMSVAVAHLPWIVAALVAGIVAAIGSALIGLIVLTARVKLQYSPIIMTLGIAFAAQGLFVVGWGDVPVSYDPLVHGALRWFGAFVLPQQVILFAIVIVLFILLQAFFSKAYLGRALSAAAMNERSAQLVGVNLLGAGVAVFVVAGVIGGIAGAVAGGQTAVIPDLHIELAIGGFVAAVFGDMDKPMKTLVGGMLLGVLIGFAASYGYALYQEVVALAALLVLLVIRTLWARRGGVLA